MTDQPNHKELKKVLPELEAAANISERPTGSIEDIPLELPEHTFTVRVTLRISNDEYGSKKIAIAAESSGCELMRLAEAHEMLCGEQIKAATSIQRAAERLIAQHAQEAFDKITVRSEG